MTWSPLRPLVAAAMLTAAVAGAAAGATGSAEQADPADVKAAFVFNFAKFAEWPDMAAGDPIVICVLDDARVASTLSALTHDQRIATHAIEIRPIDAGAAQACRVVYVSMPVREAVAALAPTGPHATPLTISDVQGFASQGGMIELFVEGGRMRFAVNVAAVQRAGIKLSSRLLGLARIVRDDRDQ